MATYKNPRSADEAFEEIKPFVPYVQYVPPGTPGAGPAGGIDLNATYNNISNNNPTRRAMADKQRAEARWTAAQEDIRNAWSENGIGPSPRLPLTITDHSVDNSDTPYSLYERYRIELPYSNNIVPVSNGDSFAYSGAYYPGSEQIDMGKLHQIDPSSTPNKLPLSKAQMPTGSGWKARVKDKLGISDRAKLSTLGHEVNHAITRTWAEYPWQSTGDVTRNIRVPQQDERGEGYSHSYAARRLPVIKDVQGYEKYLPEFTRAIGHINNLSQATYEHRIQNSEEAKKLLDLYDVFGPGWERNKEQLDPDTANAMSMFRRTAEHRAKKQLEQRRQQLRQRPMPRWKWQMEDEQLRHDAGKITPGHSEVEDIYQMLDDMNLWQQVRNDRRSRYMDKIASTRVVWTPLMQKLVEVITNRN